MRIMHECLNYPSVLRKYAYAAARKNAATSYMALIIFYVFTKVVGFAITGSQLISTAKLISTVLPQIVDERPGWSHWAGLADDLTSALLHLNVHSTE